MKKKFEVDILSASNFTSFGFCMSGRKHSTPSYLYGFNGKEKDDEINEEGNSYDFGARIYDSRIAKFLSVDPDQQKYAWQSTYVFAANSPIFLIDLDGKGPDVAIKTVTAAFNDGKKASSYSITVYVDQPGSGGDRDAWETDFLNGETVDVGHTFIKLTKINEDGTQVEKIVGFYPSATVDLDHPEIKGEFHDDNGHQYDVAKTFAVSEGQFTAAINTLNSMDGANYNLNTKNCTDAGIGCVNAAGQGVKDTQGTWGMVGVGSGGGSNPGDLGEDLRVLPGAVTTPGNASATTTSGTGTGTGTGSSNGSGGSSTTTDGDSKVGF